MRKRRGHFAERGKPRHVKQLLLLLLYSCFCPVAFGHVAAKAGKEASGSRMHLADGKLHGKGGTVLAHSGDGAAKPDDPALSCRQIAVQVGVMLVTIGRRHQQIDVLADDFA